MNDGTQVTGYSPPTDSDQLVPGQIVGEFRIEALLGRGGMGTVYGAVHTVIGKRGAMKVLRKELCTDSNEIARFVQEARAVNQIGHPNIVDVFAFGTLPDGRSYLVMEWLTGESLRARMRRGMLPREETRDVLTEIIRALEAAHAKGIIHRDLKPDNVFLVEVPGERPRAKLLDFGVAKLTGAENLARTKIGGMLGTPQYIAPEQARGEATLQSDIYALGVMLYEMLAGRVPFIGENAFDVVSMHMMEPPPKLMKYAAVSESIENLVDAMLAKEAADRPSLATVRTTLADLTPRYGSQIARTQPRSRAPLLFVLALVLAVIGGVVAFLAVRSPTTETVAVASGSAPDPKPAPIDAAAPVVHDAAPIAVDAAELDAADPQAGFVVVKVVPAGATLLIDNQAEAAPGKPYQAGVKYELLWGKHTVAAKFKGNLRSQIVIVQAGHVQEVSIQVPSGAQSKEPVFDPYNNAPR